MSLFHFAAHVGHWDLMKSLVSDYCQHEYPFNKTLLIACRQGQEKVVRNLMRIHKFDIADGRAVNIAVAAGQAEILKYLLDPEGRKGKNASSYDINANAWSILNIAATNGHEMVIDTIFNYCDLGKAIYINTVDEKTGRTALFSAVMNGHGNVVRKLLASGAKIETNGTTAVHIAAEYGHEDIYRILLTTVPENLDINRFWWVNDFESVSETTDDCESYSETTDIGDGDVPSLLRFFDTKGDIPLHKAARNGHSAVVESILEDSLVIPDPGYNISDLPISDLGTTGAEMRFGKGHTGLRAVHLAAMGGHLSVLVVLANNVINGVSNLQVWTLNLEYTALHFAAAEGHHAVVEWLLEKRVDLHVTSNRYESPLQLALEEGHDVVVRTLLRYELEKFGSCDKIDPSEIVYLIQSAANDGEEASLRMLLDCVGASGENFLREVMKYAKEGKNPRALLLLKSLQKERSWKRNRDVQEWLATFSRRRREARLFVIPPVENGTLDACSQRKKEIISHLPMPPSGSRRDTRIL